MNKYRIIKLEEEGKEWYQVQRRFLWFFWCAETEFGCDVTGHSWEDPKKFDTRSGAEYYIKSKYEPLRSIVYDRKSRTMSRHERIQDVLEYFYDVHVEDPLDGTSFDCDVMDALIDLRRKYEKEEVIEALK